MSLAFFAIILFTSFITSTNAKSALPNLTFAQQKHASTMSLAFFAVILFTSFITSTNASLGPLVISIDGGTEGIRAQIFSASTGEAVSSPQSSSYTTLHPKNGYATQNPTDWYDNCCKVVKLALDADPSFRSRIVSICLDSTCCSVCFLSSATPHSPLHPSIIWMDSRAHEEAKEILSVAKTDPSLDRNNAGLGPISAENMLPKALWFKRNQPALYADARICEYQDYMNLKLTGNFVSSSINLAVRWHHTKTKPPLSLLDKLKLPELIAKWPEKVLSPGDVVGTLTQSAAADLSLPLSVKVIQGGADAFVGMIGLGCINPGQCALITGSSHLCCQVVGANDTEGVATSWGPYLGAPLPHINFREGGQSSTGSILKWVSECEATNPLLTHS